MLMAKRRIFTRQTLTVPMLPRFCQPSTSITVSLSWFHALLVVSETNEILQSSKIKLLCIYIIIYIYTVYPSTFHLLSYFMSPKTDHKKAATQWKSAINMSPTVFFHIASAEMPRDVYQKGSLRHCTGLGPCSAQRLSGQTKSSRLLAPTTWGDFHLDLPSVYLT